MRAVRRTQCLALTTAILALAGASGAAAKTPHSSIAWGPCASVDATSHYHALQIRDFLASVVEGRPPLVTGEDGRAVVAMFTAIYRSARERRPIPVL